MSEIEKKQLESLARNIKGSHFNLGDGMNDYKTSTGTAFKFDHNKAYGAKGVLKEDLLNDLRSTHYKLGYDQSSTKTTTHQSTYIPINNTDKSLKAEVSAELRKSHFNLNNSNSNNMGKTIYMTDYTKKEIQSQEFL